MKINWYKWGLFAAIVLALMYWMYSCGVKSVIVKAGKTDTVYITQTFPKIVSVPKPYQVIKTVLKPYKVIDTSKSIVYKMPTRYPVDGLGIDPQFPTVKSGDSINCCDGYLYLYEQSERIGPGVITIQDTIQQSQILGRGLTYLADSIPVITKTVLLTQPKKTILYFGGSVYGNRNLNFGAGVDLSLKGRDDKQYGVGILYANQLYYGLTYKIPIRLKK